VTAWIAEKLERGGDERSVLTIVRIVGVLMLPAPAALALAPNAVAALFVLMLLANALIGIAAAMLQRITPNMYRGRMSAVYLLLMSLLGYGRHRPLRKQNALARIAR
jgi:hypothetical protein